MVITTYRNAQSLLISWKNMYERFHGLKSA
uniref:Uncharacterized protein n=1 Tax=Arundo donax TaxID=35708 RepID=A0A0A8Z4B7_ARUDO